MRAEASTDPEVAARMLCDATDTLLGIELMRRQLHALLALWTATAIVISGCAPTQPFYFFEDGDMSHYVGMATNIEHPDVETCSLDEVQGTPQPFTLSDHKFDQVWELELQSAVRYALENSKVMRTLGGRQASFGGSRPQQDESPDALERSPASVPTVYDPAIFEADPNFGPEGALSQFDAQLQGSFFYEKNDRPQNLEPNPQLQQFGLNRIRQQDLGTFNSTLSKRSVTGARFAVAANTIYENSNAGSRESPSDYTQNFEAQVSQPLLQGAGIFFNRIAGPFDPFNGAGTVAFDGVVLARIRTDISLADFEAGVRNLVNEVEGAYWNLYFGYRNLEARKVGRDSALATWRRVYALLVAGSKGGELDKEAQAREQYFFFRSEVETGLSDLFRAESRLRYLMGLAATDGRLIAPITEPTTARVAFDWNEIHAEALSRSVELRQQKWRIKQRELELMASKNLLLPRLDAVARYRWLGLGENLLDKNGQGYSANATDSILGTDAFSTLADGNFQESQLGVQFSMNLGFRRELITVREQQLLLARERSVLQDQELELSHGLAESVRVLDTAYTLMQTNFNRIVAARVQVEAVASAFKAGTVTLDLLLDAQRREADALSTYARALSDYNRNIAQVHFRKGSLLEYNDVYLAEGPWPGKAYFDAHRRARSRDAAYFMDYGYTRPDVVSRGAFPQHDGEMSGEGVPDGEIWQGPIQATPIESGPTRAIPQDGMPNKVGPTEAAPEELPSPGPAARMKRIEGAPRMSSTARKSTATTVAYNQPETSAGDAKSNDSFDWSGIKDGQKSKSMPTGAARSTETTRLKIVGTKSDTAGSLQSGVWHEPDAGSSARSIEPAGGWKKAQR